MNKKLQAIKSKGSVVNNKSYISLIPASLLLAGSLFLYQPAILYWANHTFLNYSFAKSFMWLFPIFLLAYGMVFLPSLIFSAKINRYYLAFLTGLALAMWVSTFFSGNTGVLDGKTFALIKDKPTLWMNGIGLLCILIIASVISFYQTRAMQFFLYTINITSMFFVLYVLIIGQKPPKVGIEEVKTNFLTFSKEKNVLLILLDTFQSDFFQEILSRHPDYAAEFSGFTYFPKSIGVAPTTYLSVPTLHSGEAYPENMVVGDYYKKTVLNHSFVKALVQNGYRGMLLNPYLDYCPEGVVCGLEADIYYNNRASYFESALLINLSVFKSVPHFLKRVIYNKGHWRLGDHAPERAQISNHMLLLLAEKMKTDSPASTVKFLHLFGTHPPAFLSETCKKLHTHWLREPAIAHDTCAVTHVIQLLQSLKKHHIYDQTAILIVADHGTSLPPSHKLAFISSSNPLFLYKPFHSTHPFTTSKKLIGLVDIPKTLCNATQDCKSMSFGGEDVMQVGKGDLLRKFPFNYYIWTFPSTHKPYPVDVYEMQGDPNIFTSWHRIFHKPLTVRPEIEFASDDFAEYFGMGWAHGKGGRRWTHGSQADLFLPLSRNADAIIEFKVSTHKFNPSQHFSVFVNNTLIGRYDVPVEKQKLITLAIPAQLITEVPTHFIFKFDEWADDPRYHKSFAVAFWEKLRIKN